MKRTKNSPSNKKIKGELLTFSRTQLEVMQGDETGVFDKRNYYNGKEFTQRGGRNAHLDSYVIYKGVVDETKITHSDMWGKPVT